MPRLSCCFCIFAPKSALMIAAKANPELFEEYVKLEETMQHKFRMELSMVDVKKALESGEKPGSMTGNWNM